MTEWINAPWMCMGNVYWENAWIISTGREFLAREKALFVVLEVGGKYYVSPTNVMHNQRDIGPFENFNEACAVAEVMCALGDRR